MFYHKIITKIEILIIIVIIIVIVIMLMIMIIIIVITIVINDFIFSNNPVFSLLAEVSHDYCIEKARDQQNNGNFSIHIIALHCFCRNVKRTAFVRLMELARRL